MKEETKTRSLRIFDITVDSDWYTTLGAAVLLVTSGLLLAREIKHFIWGHFSEPIPLHKSFWSIWNKAFDGVAAICCFTFAYESAKKSVKIASVLLGTNIAGVALLSCLPISIRVLRIAAVSGSAMRLVALTIFCVALFQWLKSIVSWDHQSELPGGEC